MPLRQLRGGRHASRGRRQAAWQVGRVEVAAGLAADGVGQAGGSKT